MRGYLPADIATSASPSIRTNRSSIASKVVSNTEIVEARVTAKVFGSTIVVAARLTTMAASISTTEHVTNALVLQWLLASSLGMTH